MRGKRAGGEHPRPPSLPRPIWIMRCDRTVHARVPLTGPRRQVARLVRATRERLFSINVSFLVACLERRARRWSSHDAAVAVKRRSSRRSLTRPLCIYSNLRDMLIKSVSCAGHACVRACVRVRVKCATPVTLRMLPFTRQRIARDTRHTIAPTLCFLALGKHQSPLITVGDLISLSFFSTFSGCGPVPHGFTTSSSSSALGAMSDSLKKKNHEKELDAIVNFFSDSCVREEGRRNTLMCNFIVRFLIFTLELDRPPRNIQISKRLRCPSLERRSLRFDDLFN